MNPQPLTAGTDETHHAGPITVVSTPPTQYCAELVEVRVHWPSDPNNPSRVAIYGPESKSWGDRPAQVNWSAIGSVSPEEATLYATAVLLAAQIAPTLRPATGKPEQEPVDAGWTGQEAAEMHAAYDRQRQAAER